MNQDNTARLKELMASHRLSLQDVARLTGRSYGSVLRWRCKSGHPIPSHLLELLELKVRQ